MFRTIIILFCCLKISISENCGLSNQSKLTNQLNFPWIADIFSTVNKTRDGSDQRLCGSTIITSSFSITAAHCFQQKYSTYKRVHSEVYLLANVLDLKNTNESQRIDVKNVFVHPDWNAQSQIFDGDIALLQFKDKIEFNENISPVCLWHEDVETIDHGKILSFISLEINDPGYFNHDFDKDHNYPKEFNVPIRSECVKSQPRFEEIYSNRSFCAGGLNSGPCLETGNSGSSLSVNLNEKYYIRGIVSASFIDIAGCDNYTYTLFTDVPKYKDWIIELTQSS